ncbi:hypothetical protein AQJ66_24650 [Streptomyces bungoensis]|uniref:Uncharacterized protein n=1 Tax=Streptomyces bungoensis TaxID=285568 RepID=A0A101SW13_9ACTN|nr:hypothetical protein [Streptomyces bungoensis]KUN81152.1 hypothetical protein AQJ66_24650 [Streptomyces bungoensis]
MSVPTPPPGQPHPCGSRTVWPLLILALALVILLVFVGLAYLTWRHPSLGTPLGTAFVGVSLVVTLAVAVARR